MSVSSVAAAPVPPPAPPPKTDKDSDKNTTATAMVVAPTAAELAKTQAIANAKVNNDGTVGPHHKKRHLHPGQKGYQPPTQTSQPGSPGSVGTQLNVKA